ncbi:hypothetical protein C475_15548 [Halosimplex carlsbadense 2-9-1]|uniref:Uncharacterized protein n=1 Tax=Halosimplex carlsbadense 2-9-1 TaxID=797114 RepID=M0CP94_9EURY|nr:hypothetical protein C475_15548 [Halosimplex carlsbadense 2-9-1]
MSYVVDSDGLPNSYKHIIKHLWDGPIRTEYSRFYNASVLHAFSIVSSKGESVIGGDTHTQLPILGREYEEIAISEENLFQFFDGEKVSVVSGWGVRAWPLVRQYSDKIRDELQIDNNYISKAEDHLSPVREESDLVLGAHIRHSDYRTWMSGQYFFPFVEYIDLLEDYVEKRHPNKNVSILVFSDEPQPVGEVDNKFKPSICQDDGAESDYPYDFAELSLCDRIIGPPSTFSTFAAFLGNSPLVPIYPHVRSKGWEVLKEPLTEAKNHPHFGSAVK